jgi:TPR repeat protein
LYPEKGASAPFFMPPSFQETSMKFDLRPFATVFAVALLMACAHPTHPDSNRTPAATTPASSAASAPSAAAIGVAKLQQNAEAGDLDAQFVLAQAYEVGKKGVAKDVDKAFLWYGAAARAGHVPAQFYLGAMYASGRGTPRDLNTAIGWYRKAAEQGYPDALYPMAYAYENGLGGLPQDNTQALAWYRKAADAGNVYAFQRLATAYRLGELGLDVDAAQAELYASRVKLGGNQRLFTLPSGKP